MENALEKYRAEAGASFAEIARRSGFTRSTVWKHCKHGVPEGAAVRYHRRLGIPLGELVPLREPSDAAQA